MNKKHPVLLILCIVIFSACHKKATTKTTTTNDNEGKMDVKNVIVDPNVDILATGSPYVVDSIALKGDVLSVFVNYSGGCKDHTFELQSNGMYLKSLPPQITVSLKHNNNEDACRKLVMQELKFNVSALKYNKTDNTIIRIGEKQINYFN